MKEKVVNFKKKEEYWVWFIIHKNYWGHGFTENRLQKAWDIMCNDEDFWSDILVRHGGQDMTPIEMQMDSTHNYEHCMGNMTGMIMETFVIHKIIKP